MAVIALFLTVLCLWIGGQCIYNLCLHPLRHYPGPLSCRISSLPRIYHRLAGTCMQHAHAAHEQHGPVVRLSPRELSFTSSDAWNDIYARHGGTAALPKEPGLNSAPPDFPRGLFNAQDGAPHARQRRIFGPAFTNTALRAQEPLLRGHVRKLVANVRRACAEGAGAATVNMADLFGFLTFDVMADLAFGAPLGLLDAGVYSPWVRNVFAVFRLLCLRVVLLQYLPLVSRMLTPLLASKAVVEKRKAYMGYTSSLVDKRLGRSEDVDRPDIWTLVEKKGDALTRAEMHANAALFMTAGTETTATALAGTVWFLTKHPETMARLVEEVRGMEGGEEAFTMETLAKLPYLDAVINESMRLYPPTPDMLYRLVPEGGAVISGSHVPAGAMVGLHQCPAYHSRHNFHRPEEFLPERWLPEAAAGGEFVNDDRPVFQPFSIGPRSCIGKNLALHEIRLALVHVLWHFDLSAAAGTDEWIKQKSYLVWEKPPLPVVVKRATHATF